MTAGVVVAVRSEPLLLPGCVGFYLAARLCLTYLFFQADPQTGAEVAFALQAALLAAAAFYTFGEGAMTFRAMMRAAPVRWVCGFLLVGLLSLTWSATVSKSIAVAYWSELAGQVAIMALLVRSAGMERAASAVMRGYIAGACLIAVITWLSPTMQDLRPGNDDFFSPNAIAFTCALAIYLLQYLSRSEGTWSAGSRIAAIFLAITLVRTLSKTTLVAFAAGQIFLLLRDRAMSRKSKVMLALSSVAVVAVFWPLMIHYFAVYENAGNQAETLTGRLGIWAFVLGRAVEQPWIGHGFHSFRNVVPPFGSFEAWHAHNEVLQQFYTYGAIGIVLLVGTYGSLYRYVERVAEPATRPLVASLLIFVVVRGLADTENFDLSLPLWLITLLSLALAAGKPAPERDRRGAEMRTVQAGDALRGCA